MHFISQAIRVIDADNEAEWRTIKGSHVMIGEGGEILKGNETLKTKLNSKTKSKKETTEKNIKKLSIMFLLKRVIKLNGLVR